MKRSFGNLQAIDAPPRVAKSPQRIGFPKGARYLISVEREFRTIILQGSFGKARKHK